MAENDGHDGGTFESKLQVTSYVLAIDSVDKISNEVQKNLQELKIDGFILILNFLLLHPFLFVTWKYQLILKSTQNFFF